MIYQITDDAQEIWDYGDGDWHDCDQECPYCGDTLSHYSAEYELIGDGTRADTSEECWLCLDCNWSHDAFWDYETLPLHLTCVVTIDDFPIEVVK